jgi:hypothetical protein
MAPPRITGIHKAVISPAEIDGGRRRSKTVGLSRDVGGSDRQPYVAGPSCRSYSDSHEGSPQFSAIRHALSAAVRARRFSRQGSPPEPLGRDLRHEMLR